MKISKRIMTATFTAIALLSATGPAAMAQEGICPDQPAEGCRVSTLPSRDRFNVYWRASSGVERVFWKWSRGEATSASDFSDMTDPDNGLILCFYGDQALQDEGTALPGGCRRANGSTYCWSSDRRGFQELRSVGGGAELDVVLRPGRHAHAEIEVSGTCAGQGGCEWNVDSVTELVVQLHRPGTDLCWESKFELQQRARQSGTNNLTVRRPRR